MATGEFNREEWARVVEEYIDREVQAAGGKVHGAKTRFADKIGRGVRTVDTWLRKDVDVKESSVRLVADAYGDNAMDILIRVGIYSRDQLPVQLTNEQIDEEQRYVLSLDMDVVTQAEILRRLDEMRTDDDRLIQEQRERDRARRRRELDFLIEQARRAQERPAG